VSTFRAMLCASEDKEKPAARDATGRGARWNCRYTATAPRRDPRVR
jgi:hypothetical protein